jgi:hypothetical protein
MKLANRVSSAYVLDLVRDRGVNFDLSMDQRAQLKADGADEALLAAIINARKN